MVELLTSARVTKLSQREETTKMKLTKKLLALLLGASFAWTGALASIDQAQAASQYSAATDYTKADSTYTSRSTGSALGSKVIEIGKDYLHTPYKFGSSSSTTRTFDCSSFVQRVFKRVGISLPRSSRSQSQVGKLVSKSNLQVGDLIFFRSYKSSSNRITHVAIYAGNNKLLHTFGKPGVTFTSFRGTSWEKRFVKARRVL